jgi:hypothetical protein
MSNEEVNLKSVDAMFATLIAEQRAMKEAVLLRMTGQDAELSEIKVQTTLTNGKVRGILERERDHKVRLATLVTVCGAFGTGIGYAIQLFFTK